MEFSLLDRIIEIQEGAQIQAELTLTGSESYLQDHFPRFPVMPGVLMLQSMLQASIWLVRKSENFSHSVVHLKQARNVKYADFMAPGQKLTVMAEIFKEDEETTTLKAKGELDGQSAVSARLTLERFNLADRFPEHGESDAIVRRRAREQFESLLDSTPPPPVNLAE
jgi:3-hydroxyacyl-[acyl-carrier-protein] dehydratase